MKRDVTSLTIPRKMNSLKDIIEFNKKNPPPEGYNQELLIRAEATDGLQNRTYLEVKRRNIVAARAILDTVLIENNLDAVITPSEPRSDTFPEFHDSASSGYSIAAIAGYPSVNVRNLSSYQDTLSLSPTIFNYGYICLDPSRNRN